MEFLLDIAGWVLVGAAIGWHASKRRGYSRISGVVSGAVLGPLAVLLYWFDWMYVGD